MHDTVRFGTENEVVLMFSVPKMLKTSVFGTENEVVEV